MKRFLSLFAGATLVALISLAPADRADAFFFGFPGFYGVPYGYGYPYYGYPYYGGYGYPYAGYGYPYDGAYPDYGPRAYGYPNPGMNRNAQAPDQQGSGE